MKERPTQLSGPTYKLVLDDSTRMYVTINEHEGQPFEIFVRNDDPKLYEWIAAITILISRLLRQGDTLAEIGKELEQINGPESRHMIPGTNIQSPSMIARVGRTLRLHEENKKENAA